MKAKIDKLGKCVKKYGKKVKALHRSKIGDISVRDMKPRRMEISKARRSRNVAKIEK